MSPNLPPILFLVLVLLLGLLLYVRMMRRLRSGRLVEVERRFATTLQRFKVEIDRFKFTRQGTVKTLLNHDHAVWTQVEELAIAGEADRETLRVRVNKYVEEIVPFFKPLAYFRIGGSLARVVLNVLYRIDFRPEEVARLKAFSLERPRSMVYIMNHRSNTDYVLAAHVLAEQLALSFAVGEWARVWPLEYLFKAFGSYFLRRGFRDPLYHTILRRYVQLVTKNGVTQALFIEGGLSRDGKLRSPKLGLIDYIICSKEDRSFSRELIFVPVAINYDRVLEDRALVAEATDRKKRTSKLTMVGRVLKILFGNVLKFARSEIRKNGLAVVRFGEPLSFDDWHRKQDVDIFSLPKEGRRAYVGELCNEILRDIAGLIPATPLCLVAKVLLDRAPIPRAGLDLIVRDEIKKLEEMGVEVLRAERGPLWIVEGALLRFELRHLVVEDDGDLTIPDEMRPVMQYYANAICHHYDGVIPTVERPKHLDRAAG